MLSDSTLGGADTFVARFAGLFALCLLILGFYLVVELFRLYNLKKAQKGRDEHDPFYPLREERKK